MRINVSLTSIYANKDILQKSITSLLNQTMKPDAIYLYLSHERYLLDSGFTKIPEWLSRLPITVRFVPNDGPYRKLIPLLKEKWDSDEVIITVDDDTVYAPNLVETMVEEYKRSGNCVGCRVVHLEDLRTYTLSQFKPVHVNNFHTGKGAVLYHPSMFKKRVHPFITDAIFNERYAFFCPTNDDIWFNLWRIYNGVACTVVLDKTYMVRDFTNKDFALYKHYNEEKNTEMYKATYNLLFGGI